MNAEEIFEEAIEEWRIKAGIGTCLIPSPLNDKLIILAILQRIYTRSPTCNTLIIVNSFNDRQDIIDFLSRQDDEKSNALFKHLIQSKFLKVLTVDFVNKKGINLISDLTVLYHPEEFVGYVQSITIRSLYKLVVLNKLITDTNTMSSISRICPILDCFRANEVEELRLNSPVEEMQIGIHLTEDSEEYKLEQYYTSYITTSINIFGSFEIMQQARIGNNCLNISADQICLQIAKENGWNDTLDMSTEFNVQIDNLYNPANLKERASKTYEIIRNRSHLLSDYKSKLEEILKIVSNNLDKKILIINKRADFANEVTNYINEHIGKKICGNYHDKVDKELMLDEYGDIVYYKSGAKKGQPRYMGADAQKSYNESMFNTGYLNVLSTNNAPNKDLSINVDIVIITSPQSESIKSYIYRLSNMRFNGILTLYTIYIKDTIEERLISAKERSNNHTIINGNNDVMTAENNYDFIVVD